MPDAAPEAQIVAKSPEIRADIARMAGLDLPTAIEIEKRRALEAEVFRISRQNGEKAYDDLSQGNEVDSVALGVGRFDISPITQVKELVPNVEKRVKEINPPPPEEHIKLYLLSFAQKALDDKDFEPAVACYNYITNEQLTTEENRPYLEKLAQAAVTEDEKYDLYLALKQVIPEAETPAEPQAEAVLDATPEAQSEAQPESTIVEAEQPQPASVITAEATDDADWKAAAGIDSTDPQQKPTEPEPAIAPQTSDAAAGVVIPQVTPATPKLAEAAPVPANVIPITRNGQPFPNVESTTVTIPPTPAAKVSTSPTPNSNGQILRPVPQDLIDNLAGAVATSTAASTEPELARAA